MLKQPIQQALEFVGRQLAFLATRPDFRLQSALDRIAANGDDSIRTAVNAIKTNQGALTNSGYGSLFKILAAALIAALVARFGLAIVVAWITSGGRPDPGYAALVYGFLPAAIGGASTIPLHRSVDTRVGLGWSVLVMIAGASLPWLILFR